MALNVLTLKEAPVLYLKRNRKKREREKERRVM